MFKSRIAIAAVLLGGVTGIASAQPPFQQEREAAVMLYVSKSFGGSARNSSAPLALGLRLDQTSTVAYTPGLSMFDARLSLSGRTTMSTMGVPLFDSSLTGRRWFASFGSSGVPPWGSYLLMAGLVGGGMCLAEWLICEDSDSDGEPDYPND
jgi:hypothetical protein